ncbi:wingless protein [Culex quinquefasciatus]|uniref:Protein Wnt n=1 Tax=Culex quinquefasciatus TaxID=7176 RepID=B0WGM5_CULQU|nr:wingless protein [Culex quinquefasciatus]|eukprot:XP_001847859.1 wingless protein [Culex quinquefasciatus]
MTGGLMVAEGSNILLDPAQVCEGNTHRNNRKAKRLTGKLAEICKNDTSLMREIKRGINLGFRECENQFRNNMWNCSWTIKRSMRRILTKDTRETAFVHAITAAGITYAVTKACTMGDLVECSCQNHSLQKNQQKPSKTGGNGQDGSWEWGGCDDNVNFGFRKSKDFLDARLRKKSDIRTLVKLHNNNAGRLAVKQFMRMECKCHGLSGSCTMRTCWMKMPPFSEVATRLKEHFDGATKVIARNDGHSFMPDDPSIKLPTKRDLVYTEDSDDFCEVNAKTGSLGTHGRECNITSNGVDGCNLMCCERGQARKHVEVKRNCKCSFKWCCEVTCSTCIDIKEVYTCK